MHKDMNAYPVQIQGERRVIMALTDDNSMVMPVQPMYGGYGNNGGFGFGGDWAWILLLLVLNGGWGGFGGMGAGMFGMGMMDGGFGLYPWLNNSQNVNDGFREQMLNTNVTSIRDGVSNLSTQLCNCCGDIQLGMANGFNGVNNSVFGAQTAISQQLNTNQLADLERSFAAQSASTAGMNAIQGQLAQCCCDNRLASAQTQALVQSENCADRYEAAKNTQSIISAVTAGIQSIKDDLCQDRLDAERRENQNLRSELMYARGQASQVEQTAQLLANNNAHTAIFQQGLNNEVDALYSRLSNCPVPTVPVYGSQRIFTCNGNAGCGCNNNF